MILIADSGSTKCDWQFLDNQGNLITSYHTMGFNPYFHSTEFILSTLNQHPKFIAYAPEVKNVFFYGAGCSTPQLNKVVEVALETIFTAAHVEVHHDLDGSAYSVYQGKPVIACILGTGSNSCHFDGTTVKEEVPALAYVLGDEGSGSYLGKKLLTSYLYKRLPENIKLDFETKFGYTKNDIIEAVYHKPNANVYLASFVRFLAEHRSDKWVHDVVFNGFVEFLEIHVNCFDDAKNVEVSFVGSIAYYFQDILEEALSSLGLTFGQVIKSPIDGLVAYHVKNSSAFVHKTVA